MNVGHMNRDNRRTARIIAIPLFVATTFVLLFAATFASAFHDPRPRSVEIGVVAPPEVVTDMQQQLNQVMPGAFDLAQIESPDLVLQAIHQREINGAMILDPENPRILIASAAGDATASAITGAFTQVGEALGVEPIVEDVRALPPEDSRGATAFFIVLAITISGLMYQVVNALLSGRIDLPAWFSSGMPLLFPTVAGILVVSTVHLTTGAISTSFLTVTGIVTLLSLAVVASAAALERGIGPPGIAIAGLTFILLGISSTGGPLSSELLPEWLQWLSPFLPQGAAVEAIRNALYFDSNAITGPLTVLTIWSITALTIVLLFDRPWRQPEPTLESPAG